MKALIRISAAFLWCFLFLSLEGHAEVQSTNLPEAAKPYGESFSVYIENDTRRLGGPNADSDYTSGVRFTYQYAEDREPAWAPPLIGWSDRFKYEREKSTTNFGISIAQQIFTPDNTDASELIINDRPYAAWLYVALSANLKTRSHSHNLELDIGLVGPGALGEQAQNGFHEIIDVPTANGWDNQLSTEPTLQLNYNQKIRFYELETDAGRTFDFIPSAGLSLGNVLIGAHIGALVRAGVRLPDDFGASSLSSVDGEPLLNLKVADKSIPWRLYGFAGIRGNAVAHNIFLDGNTIHDSHHVTKYPFNAETEVGYAFQISHWSYSWRFVTVSPEFEEKSEFKSYASISISYIRPWD
ncbi:lipid A deacylase LpxR family protein [Bdellovibrio bacteriovorus]|uniref:lipid A deacylase LpxR family protein n=1 Tax=Bdellovibrio bacteriovorus TaxID=959 RepID=UPI0009C1A13D|nr:lipid A deacylase LpxR family protein [Bdellovibrio bacteriovorus]